MNEDSANIFKENIKHNLQSSGFATRQEYEDPFSKKLKTNVNVSSSTRKDNPTESRINDMMASLFPENSNRNNNRHVKPSISLVDSQNLFPATSNLNLNYGVYEKNKFNNYEKLRYMLKESKLKTTKKSNK
jgi:hypothetical protein